MPRRHLVSWVIVMRGVFVMASKIHPELSEQLASAGSKPLQAIFRLRSPDDPDAKLLPNETARLADAVLTRAAAHCDHPVVRHNVLQNLATLIVEADAEVIHWLARQNEIASASPNKTAESPFIPPKGKRPV